MYHSGEICKVNLVKVVFDSRHQQALTGGTGKPSNDLINWLMKWFETKLPEMVKVYRI